MLSHEEDRQLRAIEQRFEESDPALTRMLRGYEVPSRDRFARLIAVDVLGGLLFLFGALFLSPVLLVFGMLFIGGGVCLHLTAGRRHGQ
jgi:Protein of unknown function (DUF3040)